MSSRAEEARDKLFTNLSALVEDVEELMKATAEQTGDGMSLLRDRLVESLEQGKRTLKQGRKALESSRRGAETAISYAQENPWAAFGIALGAGAALGFFLLSRHRR